MSQHLTVKNFGGDLSPGPLQSCMYARAMIPQPLAVAKYMYSLLYTVIELHVLY